MKTQLTDATRPRIRSGERTRTIELRMIMLTPSVTPLTNRAASETAKAVESPNTIMLSPKPATQISRFGPAWRLGGRRWRRASPAARRPRARSAGPETDRADMQDVGREERQEGDRATEEDREQVERHRADEGRRPGT